MATTIKKTSKSFELNPRGNLWAKDSGGFGRRLLSSMGWQEGQGLGKEGQGSPNCIRLRKRGIRNAGVGFTEKSPLGTQSERYDEILEKLNKKFKSDKTTTSVGSLEQRSQKFKKRLHYRKLVKGKDVGHYSEKDMNCIFAFKSSNSKPTTTPPETQKAANVDSWSTFNSYLNIKEYFDNKIKEKLGTQQLNEPSQQPKEPSQLLKEPSQQPKEKSHHSKEPFHQLKEPSQQPKEKSQRQKEPSQRLEEPSQQKKVPSQQLQEPCLDLPKRVHSDSWLESQRTAARMRLYKNMVRGLRKDPVLKTTNMTEIKGYGNWAPAFEKPHTNLCLKLKRL